LQVELDRLRAADDDFRAELSEFLPDSASVHMNAVAEALREIKNKAQQLQTMNNTLQARVAQLECTSVSQSTERKSKIEELEAERETLLKRVTELQIDIKLSQQLSKTASPVRNDSEGLASRTDELETQLCLHRGTCAATKLSPQQEQEFSRRTEEEKEQLIRKIDELKLEAKTKQDEFDVIFNQLDHDNKIIRCQNDELMRKISELEMAATIDADDQFVSEENARLRGDIEALNEAICRQSELILKMDEKLRHHQLHHQHSHDTDNDSDTATALEEELQIDGASEDVAGILARLQDQSTALEKALATRDALCRDLDLAKTHNARLSSVVNELRAERDKRDSDVVRLCSDVARLQQRLARERHEFVDAVQLVRRENAAECDKIADENRRLTTLLKELELTAEKSKVLKPTC